MNTTLKHIDKGLANSYSYPAYKQLIETLLKDGKSTTKDAEEIFVHFSKLGLQRMKRWDKKFQLPEETLEKIDAYEKNRIWIVLAEGWCGDAAHIVPVMHKITHPNDRLKLRVVLREENLGLMNEFLTNGGKSIPKLIVYDPDNQEVESTWGPRPAGAAQIFEQYREEDFEKVLEPKLQAWYNHDKGQTTAKELMALLA